MKISINELKFTPSTLIGVNVCVYGEPTGKVKEWIEFWKLPINYQKPYSNMFIRSDMDLNEMFEAPPTFEYVDGFSPNLNKHLHIGHLSNLVLAKAYQGLGVGKKFIAIFGDTLGGSVTKDEALIAYENICKLFKYKVDKQYFASEVKLLQDQILKPGDGKYESTKIFEIGAEKVVGIKSDGSTSYFYQDVALAQHLNSPTLYLTGVEQENHFNLLHQLFPKTQHIGLGLIKYNGKKMSSSEGNVIYVSDVIDTLMDKFNGNSNLVYNVLAGNILKSEPKSEKNIDTKTIDNVKLSMGLYVSYTMARMHSVGIDLTVPKQYKNTVLKMKSLKSKASLKPHILFEGLVSHCETINFKYRFNKIKGDNDNTLMFQKLTSDVVLAASELGLLPVTKV